MIFHENRQLVEDSHETSYIIFRKLGKMSQNLSSAAGVISALMVKAFVYLFEPAHEFLYLSYMRGAMAQASICIHIVLPNISLQRDRERQWELPRPIPRNFVESDHGFTSMIYFDNSGDNVTLT